MLDVLIEGFDISRFVGNAFTLLLALIVMDIVTGILVAGKERKINSSINFDGMIRKVGELLALVFITLVDVYLQTEGKVTTLGVSMLVIYEVLSIIENFSRIGVNLNFLTKFFDPEKVQSKGNNKHDSKGGTM